MMMMQIKLHFQWVGSKALSLDEFVAAFHLLQQRTRQAVEQVRLAGFEHALSFTAIDGKDFLRS